MSKALLGCTDLHFSYAQNNIIAGLDLSFRQGEFVGLIGPNGTGKSTLLQLLMGLLPYKQGEVQLEGRPLLDYSKREIAQNIAFVPQDLSIEYAFSVREIVAMGRNPYLGAYQTETGRDQQIVSDAIQRVDLFKLAERRADQLSGGERQRVFIARSLAQQAKTLLLDEPTASLDLCHQLDLMLLVRALVDEGHLAIAAIHDLQLASRFCDRLILLAKGRIVADGTPEEVVTEDNLQRYFSIDARVEQDTLGHGLRITALTSKHC